MSKTKTKQLFNEVSKYIKENMNFHIECGYSDYGNKSSICYLNPNFRDENGNRNKDEFMFKSVCEFSVWKKTKKEHFIIWDYRIYQPYENSKNCVYGGSFGRYEFTDRESFYKHILSDFGPHLADSTKEERKTSNSPLELCEEF